MSDIVERLLNDAESHYEVARSADMRPEDTLNWEHGQNCQEAADTITRLRADIINYKIGNKDLQDHCAEITSLTAEVEQNAIDLEEYKRDVERLRAALEPFAHLYLWPFDHHLAEEIMADADWCEEENDVTEEELFIRRKYIRAARAALSGDKQ